jgi:hypothetical protein
LKQTGNGGGGIITIGNKQKKGGWNRARLRINTLSGSTFNFACSISSIAFMRKKGRQKERIEGK